MCYSMEFSSIPIVIWNTQSSGDVGSVQVSNHVVPESMGSNSNLTRSSAAPTSSELSTSQGRSSRT